MIVRRKVPLYLGIVKKYVFILIVLGIILPQVGRAQGVELSLENDALYFPSPTDRYYTNGLMIQYWLPASEGIQWNFSLQHRMYNGSQNSRPEPIPGDRPFTSTLLLEGERSSWANASKVRTDFSATIGILGPEARGGELQNEVHSWLEGSTEAYGWDRQLQSMPVLQLSFERQHMIGNDFLALTGRYGSSVGTLITEAHVGGTVFMGLIGDPLAPRTKSESFIRAKISSDFAAVLHDATLVGSPFTDDPVALDRNEVHLARWNGSVGIESLWKGLSLSVELHWLSSEAQGLEVHRYGAIRLGYFF